MDAAAHKNISLVRHALESLESGDLDACVELLAADFTAHLPGLPEPLRGREVWRMGARAMLDGFPDLRILLVSGEACPQNLVTRWQKPGRIMLNAYGPTEATVTCTLTELYPNKPVTIGGPLPTYSIVILAELPGISAGDLRLEVRGSCVVLSGAKPTDPLGMPARFHCMERSRGRFQREIQLSEAVNTHLGRARLEGGILTVELPKITEQRRSARILEIEEGKKTA